MVRLSVHMCLSREWYSTPLNSYIMRTRHVFTHTLEVLSSAHHSDMSIHSILMFVWDLYAFYVYVLCISKSLFQPIFIIDNYFDTVPLFHIKLISSLHF